jgi:hypothetical protein
MTLSWSSLSWKEISTVLGTYFGNQAALTTGTWDFAIRVKEVMVPYGHDQRERAGGVFTRTRAGVRTVCVFQLGKRVTGTPVEHIFK